VVLVGKGVTYDSGGYHVKPLTSMMLMKKDMAAAAAVLAATEAAAARKLNVKVTALLACAENMISGDAFRPGDIIPSRSGQTIEIRSTDAEGRLVMADALTYAGELKADMTIDMGTLTGVAARFVGDAMAPATGSDPELIEMLRVAGDAAHERLMPYPMLKEFKEATRGKISDLRNWGTVGGHGAGTVVCAGFLSHFAEGQRWAHIDMSNMSWANEERDDWTWGGTGYGVRLLTEFFVALAKA
jgi:leucyl aminopeptidase